MEAAGREHGRRIVVSQRQASAAVSAQIAQALTTADLIDDGLRALDGEGCDAVLGPALDGGYWAIGLRRADPRAFDGVPMSQPDTGRHQRAALDRLGLRVRTLRTLRDVDDHADAVAVAAEAPTTRFARALAELGPLPSSRDATGSPTRSPTTGTESRR